MSFDIDPKDEVESAPCPECGEPAFKSEMTHVWACSVCVWLEKKWRGDE